MAEWAWSGDWGDQDDENEYPSYKASIIMTQVVIFISSPGVCTMLLEFVLGLFVY